MSNFKPREKAALEDLFEMSGGYVLNFSDSTFGDFFGDLLDIDIHSEKYHQYGPSKAKKLRGFMQVEPDHIVGKVILALVDHKKDMIEAREEYSGICDDSEEGKAKRVKEDELIARCEEIGNRLCSGRPQLQALKNTVEEFDADHLAKQIHRMENSVNDDPDLAIGTAKELIETCCKTILAARGKEIDGRPDVAALSTATLKTLKLVPDDIPDAAKGNKIIKRLLQNIGTVGVGIAELRNLYGTGHGKNGDARGLTARHAKLAVGSAATLVTFLFETHQETKNNIEDK